MQRKHLSERAEPLGDACSKLTLQRKHTSILPVLIEHTGVFRTAEERYGQLWSV
jgi:hypothetical protein